MSVRRDGTLGSLFINRRQVIPVGVWLEAEDHKTKGFAHRPGWHTTPTTDTHLALSAKGHKRRVWAQVEIMDYRQLDYRCGDVVTVWYLAEWMRVVKIFEPKSKAS
jgi:hypothetical protein